MTGIFLIHSLEVFALFDSGASNSFISPLLVAKLGLEPSSSLDLRVRTASGEVRLCDRLFEGVPIVISRVEFPVT